MLQSRRLKKRSLRVASSNKFERKDASINKALAPESKDAVSIIPIKGRKKGERDRMMAGEGDANN